VNVRPGIRGRALRRLAGFGIGSGAYCLMVFPGALIGGVGLHLPAVLGGLLPLGVLCALFMPTDASP
jgi:hypothetical protein